MNDRVKAGAVNDQVKDGAGNDRVIAAAGSGAGIVRLYVIINEKGEDICGI